MSDDPQPTRVSILFRLRDGSTREVAAHDFYARYQGIVRGYARRLGADDYVADDVVQDVLSGFVARVERFDYDRALGGLRRYLFACTNHAIKERHKARMRAATRSLDDLDLSDPELVRHWSDAWEEALLPRAIARLRSEWQATLAKRRDFEVFERIDLRGWSDAEVRDALALTADQVYQAKHRVRAALKRMLTEFDPLDL